jgi:hypothetical protein
MPISVTTFVTVHNSERQALLVDFCAVLFLDVADLAAAVPDLTSGKPAPCNRLDAVILIEACSFVAASLPIN